MHELRLHLVDKYLLNIYYNQEAGDISVNKNKRCCYLQLLKGIAVE